MLSVFTLFCSSDISSWRLFHIFVHREHFIFFLIASCSTLWIYHNLISLLYSDSQDFPNFCYYKQYNNEYPYTQIILPICRTISGTGIFILKKYVLICRLISIEIVCSQQQNVIVPISQFSSPQCVPNLIIFSNLIRRNGIQFLVHISIRNDVEYLFLCLRAICIFYDLSVHIFCLFLKALLVLLICQHS